MSPIIEKLYAHLPLLLEWRKEQKSYAQIGEKLRKEYGFDRAPAPTIIMRVVKNPDRVPRADTVPQPVAAPVTVKPAPAAVPADNNLHRLQSSIKRFSVIRTQVEELAKEPMEALLYDGKDETTGQPSFRSSRELSALLQVRAHRLRALEVEARVTRQRSQTIGEMIKLQELLKSGRIENEMMSHLMHALSHLPPEQASDVFGRFRQSVDAARGIK